MHPQKALQDQHKQNYPKKMNMKSIFDFREKTRPYAPVHTGAITRRVWADGGVGRRSFWWVDGTMAAIDWHGTHRYFCQSMESTDCRQLNNLCCCRVESMPIMHSVLSSLHFCHSFTSDISILHVPHSFFLYVGVVLWVFVLFYLSLLRPLSCLYFWVYVNQ